MFVIRYLKDFVKTSQLSIHESTHQPLQTYTTQRQNAYSRLNTSLQV